MDFSKRLREDELMDDSELSANDLKKTYDDIARANRLLGGNKDILDTVEELISENPKEKYTIIDVGSGDGEILRKVCTFFREKGIKVQLTGVDLNEKAIVLAKAASEDFPEIHYEVMDVLEGNQTLLKADFVLSTLTMHHIAEAEISTFLERLTKMANIAVVINDLQRSRIAYYLFKLFSVIFIKTKIAKNDGLVSIRSGFIKKELFQYSLGFPAVDYSIRSKWAFRYVWVMRVKRPNIHE